MYHHKVRLAKLKQQYPIHSARNVSMRSGFVEALLSFSCAAVFIIGCILFIGFVIGVFLGIIGAAFWATFGFVLGY